MDQQFAQELLAKTRADYDRVASSFSETRGRAYDLEPLVSDVKSGDRVLDVGCGNGRLLDVLPVGVHYTGCDTSERMLEVAQRRFQEDRPLNFRGRSSVDARFVIGDILALPFVSASFDHVFALAVLHHIPSDALRQQAVRELARVVKPGGRVIITVWNLRSWYWIRRYRLWRLLFGVHPKGYDRGDCFVPWRRGTDEPIIRYVHAFTMTELTHLLQSASLCITGRFSGKNHVITAS